MHAMQIGFIAIADRASWNKATACYGLQNRSISIERELAWAKSFLREKKSAKHSDEPEGKMSVF